MLYQAGQRGRYFNLRVFWKWIIFSIWHGICTYFAPTFIGGGEIDASGRTASHWYNSTISFTIIIHFVTLKLFTESKYWNWIAVLAAVVSVLSYYIFLVIIAVPFASLFLEVEGAGMAWQMLGSGKTWLMCVLYPCICLIPDLALNFIASVYFPTPAEVVMAEQKGKREAIHARAT